MSLLLGTGRDGNDPFIHAGVCPSVERWGCVTGARTFAVAVTFTDMAVCQFSCAAGPAPV